MTNINYTNLYNYIRVVFHYTRIIYLRAKFPDARLYQRAWLQYHNISNLSRAQVNTASRLDRTAAGVDLTRVDRTAGKSVTDVSGQTAALKLIRSSEHAFGVLVTRRITGRAAING